MTSSARVREESTGVMPEVRVGEILVILASAIALVVATRLPFARAEPFEPDEFGFIQKMGQFSLPMHHTLFLAAARIVGQWIGEPYRGLIVVDMATSALALVSVWWWLRALVRPATALAATLLVALAPTFWSYGAMAGNYTAIPLVGAFLLGVAVRTWHDPRPWHPYAAAALLAIGAGYRQDIGTFWAPIFLLILWRHRWKPALGSFVLFVVLNLAWFVPMLVEVGGWTRYRAASRDFAQTAGYQNSVFYLGFVDASVRYAVKIGLALCWTFGLALLVIPLGVIRLFRSRRDLLLPAVLALSVVPALGFHLTIHFGVPGYAFHYVPALIALVAMGVGRIHNGGLLRGDEAPGRLLAFATISAAIFLGYMPDYESVGMRGSFDLSVGRCSRVGLVTRPPERFPTAWRTPNSMSFR